MSSNLNRVHIAAFTHNYLFRGIVVTGTKRLSDVVNDRITAYMELLEARAMNLMRPEKTAFQTSGFYLKKQRVDAIAIIKEEVYLPARRIYSFVPKEKRPALLVLRAYELRGYIHLHGKHEVMGPLTREGELFVPVTEATLTSTTNPKIKISAPTILIRETALDGFHVAEGEVLNG